MFETLLFILFTLIIINEINRANTRVLNKLRKVLAALEPQGAVRLVFMKQVGGQYVEVNQMDLKVSDTLKLRVGAKDKFGNIVTIEGVPAWTASSSTAGSLTAEADGIMATFVPAGLVESFSIDVSLNGLSASLPIELKPGAAASLEITTETIVG